MSDQQQGTFGGYEDAMRQAAYNNDFERTKHDKLLSREEVMRLRELMKKDIHTTDDIQEIMNIAVSTEIKLTRFSDWDRYVLGKYLIWVGEYAKRYSKALRAKKYYEKHWDSLTARTKELRKEIEKDYAEQFKQCVHAYFFLARSPLSLEGGLIDAFTTDRKDFNYTLPPAPPNGTPQQNWLPGR